MDSRTLITGDNSVIGLYELPILMGFPGLGMGIIFPSFHMSGIFKELTHRLNVSAMYVNPFSPTCLSMIIARPSGPIAVEAFAALIALDTSSGVISTSCV